MSIAKRIHIKRTTAFLALVSGLMIVGIACSSSDDNPEPSVDPIGDGDAKGGSGGDGGSGGSGGGDGGGDPGCWESEPRVCFSCEPERNEEFLDACTDAQCVPFDNGKLTKLLPDGKVPPLP